MNKFLLRYALFLAVLLVGLSSCKKQDDFTGDATWKATSTAGSINGGPHTIVEKNEDIVVPITLTLTEPQIVDVRINITDLGGTATNGDDYTFDNVIIIPAHQTSGVCNVTIVGDHDAEDDETFSLQFGDSTTTNVSFDTKKVDFTIKSHDMALTFDWSGTANLNGTDIELCDSVDMDFYVMDGDTVDLKIYDAATGACPESILISNYENGDYYFWVDFYLSKVHPTTGTIGFPLKISATRGANTDAKPIDQPSESVLTSADPDGVTTGNGAFKSVIKVTVKDDGFDVINPYTGAVLLSL